METKPAAAPGWPWPDELDARIAAAASHRKLFENDPVRYLEVVIRPGEFDFDGLRPLRGELRWEIQRRRSRGDGSMDATAIPGLSY